MTDSNPAGSIKSRWHSYREGHFLQVHGVIKGSAGAGTALLLELSDDNAVLKALERNSSRVRHRQLAWALRRCSAGN